jgi:hypothetical protein
MVGGNRLKAVNCQDYEGEVSEGARQRHMEQPRKWFSANHIRTTGPRTEMDAT